MASQPKIESNGESFTFRTYMGVSVLVRDGDGYVNASKLENGDEGRRARNFIGKTKEGKYANGNWQRIVESFEKNGEYKDLPAQISLHEGYDNDVRGIYIHPDLVDFVAEWVDLDYAWVVVKFLKIINKQLHSVMEDNNLPDESVVVKTLLDTAEVELKVRDVEIEELEKRIGAIEEEKEQLDKENKDKSVRVDINNKKLKIIELKEFYYVSGDQDYSKFERLGEKIRYFFWFPASMNMRQAVRRDFKKGDTAPVFEKEELKQLVKYLLAKDPKSAEKW
jgi:hypothetical protein